MMDDTLYYYWLSTVDGLSIKRIKNIIECFGSAKLSWEASLSEYKMIDGISSSIAERMISRKNKDKLLSEIQQIQSKGIRILSIDDDEYPDRLKEIYDPPHILYIKGKIKKGIKNVAIVGCRKCTSYGRLISRNISKHLSEYTIGVVSGMARGIDTEAHKGALDSSGYTCAVLGCGLDIVYPPENATLMKNIAEQGAVISEYPPGTMPNAYNFPCRNRIISGISDAVVIIEAGEKSGALITTDFALEQGRDVYAVPGNILSDMSKGTNNLIKDGARPLTDLSDILYDLGYKPQFDFNKKSNISLDTREKMLMDIINDCPIYIDDLIKKVSLKVGEINSSLTTLELKGIIKILPGKYIVRII